MLFSVLIANYNNSRYLGTAIESVLAQDHADWELILVDDASSDDFGKAIAPYRNDKRIKIFWNDRNYGCGYTKARCARLASGAILGFLDPDDALASDALRVMSAAHLERPSCSLIHSTHFICDGNLSVRRVAEYPRPLPAGTPYLLVGDGRIHHFASFKKVHYDRTEGISPANKRAVDQDLYYKLEEAGDVFFIDRPLYYYRIHGNSISNSGNEPAAQLAHYSIIEEACLRRIGALQAAASASGRDLSPLPNSPAVHPRDYAARARPQERMLQKKYRTRYYKTRLFHCFRQRLWLPFIGNFFAFSLTGGMGNLLAYLRKLPAEGGALLKRSFVDSYKIRT